MADSKYLEQVTGTADPYGVNPFAQADPASQDGVTPFADELPFRFTQFALNPSAQATSGQTGRAAVARSPFTSGVASNELRALRDRIAGLPTAMPTAPTAPIMPDISTDKQLVDTSFSSQPSASSQDLRWGLPLKEYQVPARLLEDYGGRNPVDLAIQYGRGGGLRSTFGTEKVDWGKYKDSPMTAVTGYDMESILGADKWNDILSAKNLNKGSEDRLFYNLAILPTDINPNLENKENLASLALRDFADVNRSQVVNPEALAYAAEQGYDVSSGRLPPGAEAAIMESGFNQPLYVKDPNYKFDPKDAEYYLRTNPETGGIRGFLQKWAPTTIKAGAAATIGYGIGGALAPVVAGAGGGAGATAGGAGAGATTSAGGLAGLAGMTPGVAATGVNLAGNVALSVGAQKALQEAGIPLDHPLAQMLVQIGASAVSTAASGPQAKGAGVEVGSATQEQSSVLQALKQTADSQGISVKDMAAQFGMSEGDLFEAVRTSGIVTEPSAYQGGFIPTSPASGPDFKKQGLQGLQSGLETYQGMTAGETGGGIPTEQLYTPDQTAQYQNEMTQYEAAMQEYNKMVEEYELAQRLQEEYEAKFADFNQQANAYKTYQSLRSRQAELESGIQSNIAENPYYQADPRLYGIQSMLVD